MSESQKSQGICRVMSCGCALYGGGVTMLQRVNPLAPISRQSDAMARMISIALLSGRAWIAWIFFNSGMQKINNWDNTLFLFEYEYSVPLLPVAFAAFSATAFELICPVLISLGWLTRLAVLPLIAMTLVIELTYQHHLQHWGWLAVLVLLLLNGAGRMSADAWITKRWCK